MSTKIQKLETYLMIKSTSLLATVTVTDGNFSEGRFWFASTVALQHSHN